MECKHEHYTVTALRAALLLTHGVLFAVTQASALLAVFPILALARTVRRVRVIGLRYRLALMPLAIPLDFLAAAFYPFAVLWRDMRLAFSVAAFEWASHSETGTPKTPRGMPIAAAFRQ